MVVREALQDDLPALQVLYSQLLSKQHTQKITPPVAAMWRQVLQDPHQHVLVVEDGGVLVSSCILVVPKPANGLSPYAFVENIITHAARRKKGYARALTEHAQQIATENGCNKILLRCNTQENRILYFLSRVGFVRQDATSFIMPLSKH